MKNRDRADDKLYMFQVEIDMNATVAELCAGDNKKRMEVQEMFDHHEHGGEA